MPIFHDKLIFDEDIDASYSLDEQKEDPKHTLERSFTPLKYYYGAILKIIIDNDFITLSNNSRPYEPKIEPP